MKKGIRTVLLLIAAMLLLCGCTAKMGYIVRYDITKDDLDVFYIGITQEKIRQAFGLPHLYRRNGKPTLYQYNLSNGFFEVYFWYGMYAGNSVF